ncbi:MAG TPA: CHASE2 domain-containing protein, partial [Spirochaetota bacterium]|nr:CHASE2 domain-containing protein [Spirochaetota bacterium]
MKMTKKDIAKMLTKKRYQRSVIISFSLIILLFIYAVRIYDSLNFISYDIFLNVFKKPVKQDESIVLADIDDNSMNADFIPYSWPWPRYIFGDAMEVFADFGARAAVFDIEFLGNSAAGVNVQKIEGVKETLANKFQEIFEEYSETTKIVAQNKTFQKDLKPLLNSFNENLTNHYMTLEKGFDSAILDNDTYFGKRLKYFGKGFGTVNLLTSHSIEESFVKEEQKKLVEENLKKFGVHKDLILKGKKYHKSIIKQNLAEFPTQKILENFNKIGFTRVETDLDAGIRSVNLFMEKDDYVFAQLSLRPFLSVYGITEEQIDLSDPNNVVLKNVKIKDKTTNIKIPVDNKGKMLINWPKGKYEEIFINKEDKSHFSFSYIPYYKYVILKNFEKNLNSLSTFQEDEALSLIKDYKDFVKEKENMVENTVLADEIRIEMGKYFDDFINRVIDFSKEENIVLREKEIDAAISQASVDQKGYLLTIKKDIRLIFEELNKSAVNLFKIREILKDRLKDKVCFIGLTATGTTDIGKTPYDKEFKKVGTHPSVFNTILQRDFIYSFPNWLILIATLLIFGSIVWVLTRQKATIIASVGFLSTLLFVVILGLIFRLTNIYISPVFPFFYGLTSFIIMIVLEYIVTEQDKSFIRNAFNRYLSPAVIQELIKDPDKVDLGGERKNCTAMFTDIESFSSLSERFMEDPKGLVSLLNNYLSAMSDIVLDNGGTIDKYEGDAIIAFFGAPLNMPDHPYKACVAAIRMKQTETDLNKKLIDMGIIEKPLKTRIGVNTGDMFVGNMGTFKRLDYTMMGHNVNLAARIEGVNKQYKTYNMISEFTYEFVKDTIVTRKLDRVRVVNIKTP